MSKISVKTSNNLRNVCFSLDNEEYKKDWIDLIELHNDYFINYFEDWIQEFELNWEDFFVFYNLLVEKSLENCLVFSNTVRDLLLKHNENKTIASQFPYRSDVDISEMELLDNKLKDSGFKRQLTSTQLRDLVKMMKNKNSANFSVPGAGKTSVMLAKILLNNVKNILIFVPNDVVMDTWKSKELSRCYNSNLYYEPVELTGNLEVFKEKIEKSKNNISSSKLNFYFATYSAVENKKKEELLKKLVLENKFHIVLDESHKIKSAIRRGNQKAGKRAEAVFRIGMFSERRDILTGTPMPNGIMDIISQIEFLYPFCGLREELQLNEFNPGIPIQGLFARTTKQDLKDLLPEVNNKKVPVPMGIAQMAFYQTVIDFYTREFRNIPLNTITKKVNKAIKRIIELSVDPLNVINKIEAEEQNTKLSRFIEIDNREKNALQKIKDEVINGISKKMEMAIEITKEKVSNGQKVVIWSQFTNPILVLEKALFNLGVVTLYGSTKNSNEVIDKFNSSSTDVMVLISNPQKGGEGISLHEYCFNAIYLDRDYDAAKYLQSRDRIHRIGLKNPKENIVNYYFLESTHPGEKMVIDERISKNLKSKLEHMDSLLNDEDIKKLALDEEESDNFTSPFSDIDLEDSIDWLYS